MPGEPPGAEQGIGRAIALKPANIETMPGGDYEDAATKSPSSTPATKEIVLRDQLYRRFEEYVSSFGDV